MMKIREYDVLRLQTEDLACDNRMKQIFTICDENLGYGLYTGERMKKLCEKEDHYFYYIMKNKSVIGVFYCYADTFCETDLFHQVNESRLTADMRIGIGQSIALKMEARKKGISEYLLNYATRMLFEQQHVEAILVPAYVKDGVTPAKAHLEKCGYRFLHMLDHPWADCTTLRCHLCGTSPCSCDGAAYIKWKEIKMNWTEEKIKEVYEESPALLKETAEKIMEAK